LSSEPRCRCASIILIGTLSIIVTTLIHEVLRSLHTTVYQNDTRAVPELPIADGGAIRGGHRAGRMGLWDRLVHASDDRDSEGLSPDGIARDRQQFLQALDHPPKPNAALRRLMAGKAKRRG
jgi:Protein of unknown function (DUF1778)